jgi:hypothetical protein
MVGEEKRTKTQMAWAGGFLVNNAAGALERSCEATRRVVPELNETRPLRTAGPAPARSGDPRTDGIKIEAGFDGPEANAKSRV